MGRKQVAIFALFILLHASLSGVASSAENDEAVSYGMDVSFPIHHRISTNYPWLPHNVDPENNPTPTKYEKMPIQPLGDRQTAYTEHLEGCRAFFSEDARQCDIYEYDRILMNNRQPQSMQNYTEVGFKKVRAPAKVFELAEDFWNKNHHNQKPEAWPTGNTYTNSWKAPTYHVSVDDRKLRGSGAGLKQAIWDSLHGPIEAWTQQKISPTSMYGIRVYTEGAVLLPHVDRLPLVSSAMINIAQDVDEDWPMEIYDHDGMAHNVTLHPGDMLLFESHSVIHGRPFPLKGRFYAMLFVHFEPTGHSLRHDANHVEVEDLHKKYAKASEDGVSGQSAENDGLPPYIQKESPEEIHWKQMHPEGWREPNTPPSSSRKRSAPVVHRAAAMGDVETVKESISETKEEINKRNEDGWQPIHEGAAGGHVDVVELLVDNGADINVRTQGGTGATPLFLAEKNNGVYDPVVQYLKKLGALNVGPEL